MPIDPGKRAHRALRVVCSTTAEPLCEDLARRLSARWSRDLDGLPRIGAFDRVVVAVQGKGLERWMRRRLAARLGVIGGIETPYLRRFLFDVAGMVTGTDAPSRDRDDTLELAYRVAQEIAGRCGATAGDSGASHDARSGVAGDARRTRGIDAVPRVDAEHVLPLVTDSEGSRAHPHALLACGHRLAAIFDALEVERPELVVAWREGKALPDRAPWMRRDAPDHGRLVSLCAWMHRLWWWTAGPGARGAHPAECWSGHRAWQSVRDSIAILASDAGWRDAQARLDARRTDDDRMRLPSMVSVFGVSSLPPLALDFLAALGRRIDVSVHLVVPTDQYMDPAVIGCATGGEEDEAHLDALWTRGQRLLSVCGRQPMAMQHRVLAIEPCEHVSCSDMAEGGASGMVPGSGDGTGDPGSALHALQRSLRECTRMDRSRAADGSISVHLVSGATRAAEVLRDQVLDAFAALPGTGPDDVLVLTTDVERYGTAIARAMDAASPRPVPVTLADRSVRVERDAVRTYCDALRMLDGEITLDSLGEVIASATVAERAGVSAEDAAQCIERLHKAGGRRFIDAEHRHRTLAATGGPEAIAGSAPSSATGGSDPCTSGVPDGTVCDASDRLAMSVAMSHEVGGTELPGMARVCATVDALMALGRRTAPQRPMREWCAWARDLLDAVVPRRGRSSGEGDMAAQRAAIGEAIRSVDAAAAEAGLVQDVPFAAARGEIVDAIDRTAAGRRFGAAGGVMVGGLVPMRSVPSRIVALVGLDRGAFPRRDERSGIDPRRWSRCAGDRSPRDEDRALFLEAIHAAADRLIIISDAVDAASGGQEPASPLVDLLVEQCGEAARVTRHGVHAFGEEEWSSGDDGRARRDAHARRCAVARRTGAGAQVRRRIMCPEIGSPVDVSDAMLARVGSVDAIAECMRDPARWWLEAMGARLASMEPDTDEREPGAIGSLLKWSLEQAVIEQAVRGGGLSIDRIVSAQRAAGALPSGAAADAVTHALATWLDTKVRPATGFGLCPASPHEWQVDGPGGALLARGWRSDADCGTQVLFRGGSWRTDRFIEIALHAAAWAASGGVRTVVIPEPDPKGGLPAEIIWRGTAASAARALHELRRIAAAGTAVPLCIHPMLVAEADLPGLAAGSADAHDAVRRALDGWLGRTADDRSRGEADGRAMRVVFQGLAADEVLAGPRDPAEGALKVAGHAMDASGTTAHGAVRTDFAGLWPAIDRILGGCGWSRSASGGIP
jgi:exonuclease V gamma subunit